MEGRILRGPAFCVMAWVFLTVATPALALDVFTLWRQPMIPIEMHEGAWADYRTQVMAGGRREHGLTRIVCLDRQAGTDEDSWLVEILPLTEDQDGLRTPLPGEGVRMRVSRALLKREGRLLDAVSEIVQWKEGVATSTTVEQLRDDPLVAAALQDEFIAAEIEVGKATHRVIQERQYLCDQFVFTAADTQAADLPAGRMIQETTREISAAVNSEIPFLGLAYATERIRSTSRLDPPSRRFSPPPPTVRVEIMELVGFGGGAQPVLGGTH